MTTGRMGRGLRVAGVLVAYALVYASGYWLSVHFALVGVVAVLWLPSGITLSAMLLLGGDRRWWPSVLATGFAAELLTSWWVYGPPTGISLLDAGGNEFEALLGAILVQRISRVRRPTLDRSREVLALGTAAVAAPAVNAALYSVYASGAHFLEFWTGDVTGIVALTPAVLAVFNEVELVRRHQRVLTRSLLEVAAFALVTIAAVLAVFGRSNLTVADASVVAGLWLVLAWAAFRIGPTATAVTSLVVILSADLFTRAGRGPYGAVAESAATRVAAMQGFLCVLALSSSALAAGLREREQAEAALAHVSERDPVTGLATLEVARARLGQARAAKSLTAALIVDLDEFTDVNERYGREVADLVLRQVGERLGVPLRTEDVVARMAGDAFLLVLSRLASLRSAEITAERVLATLTAPVVVGQHVITVSACSGLALLDPGESTDRCLSRALAGVTQSKQRGPGRSTSLDAKEFGRLDEARRVQTQLHRAIGAGELRVHYQPIVDVRDRRIVAVESLVRWEHPELGLLAAGSFVPGAEASGLVVALDDWVMDRALHALTRLREAAGLESITLFVNVSARTLAEPDSSDRIRGMLRERGISPASVVLEVTETALVDDSETGRRAAVELAGAGITLAIDDFGQGHASLARLRALPISVVKIDASFVSGMGTHEVDDAVVRWVTQLAKQLRMSTVAEGVESPDQVPRLAAIGVDFVQGHALARPMPLKELLGSVDDDGRLVVAATL